MKKNISLAMIAALALLFSSGCALVIDEDNYAMAARGDYTLKYTGFDASKDSLHAKTIMALQDRGWTIESSGNPIKAKIEKLRQKAVASFTVEKNAITVDTKGSMVDGNKAYVPKRYVDNVMASVRKYLR